MKTKCNGRLHDCLCTCFKFYNAWFTKPCAWLSKTEIECLCSILNISRCINSPICVWRCPRNTCKRWFTSRLWRLWIASIEVNGHIAGIVGMMLTSWFDTLCRLSDAESENVSVSTLRRAALKSDGLWNDLKSSGLPRMNSYNKVRCVALDCSF